MRRLYSEEAEQNVLGAMLINPDCVDDVSDLLTADDFHYPQHRIIFDAIEDLRRETVPVDVFTVGERVEGKCEDSYVIELHQSTPSSANVMAYAKVVKDRKLERNIFDAGRSITDLINDTDLTTGQLVERSQEILTALATEASSKTQASLKEHMRAYVAKLDERFNNPASIGAKTGYAAIDKRIAGLEPGSLYMLAARPSMGKTTYAMGIAKHVAQTRGKVLVFSLEMPGDQLAGRYLASQGSIPLNTLRDASAMAIAEHSVKIMPAAATLMGLPLEIDDQASLSIADLRARARREHRKGRLELVVLDHINIAKGDPAARSRNDEIGSISGGLKALAKELNCPVLCLSQLNRQCENRDDRRPRNSDLRDSGNIEQDADVIQFLYRDEVYNENTEFKGIAEVITTKFRDGEIGTDFLKFEGQYNRFADTDTAKVVSQQEAYKPSESFSYGS